MAANAAATVMAVGLSERVDLSRSYIMVAGVGGGPPDKITVGAAAWADWVVSGDLVTELDAREMPPDWQYPKAYLACTYPWCPDGFRTGTEVFQLDPTMTGWAYRLSKDVTLQDDPAPRAYVQHYPEAVARGAPFVTTCAILGVNDFIHGTLMSEWSAPVRWWYARSSATGINGGTDHPRCPTEDRRGAGCWTVKLMNLMKLMNFSGAG
jgi:purine nucleoside permease